MESITQKDYPVAQGVILVYGAIVLVVNLLVDLLLGRARPHAPTIREELMRCLPGCSTRA